MLQFQGKKDFPHPISKTWEKLSDARFLVACIPGADDVRADDADRAACTQRPGFSFVRGTLELTIMITERWPETALTVSLHSKGIGSSSEVEAKLTFAPVETGTRLSYQAEVKVLGGLLKAVPHGLIRGAAAKIIADTWEQVESKLGAQKSRDRKRISRTVAAWRIGRYGIASNGPGWC